MFNVSQFRDLTTIGQNSTPTDTEDLLDPDVYVEYFNRTYVKQLAGTKIKLADLPAGDRIVDRIERHLATVGIKVRPSGGYNHYLVAATFAGTPPATLNADTIAKFAALFEAINKIY